MKSLLIYSTIRDIALSMIDKANQPVLRSGSSKLNKAMPKKTKKQKLLAQEHRINPYVYTPTQKMHTTAAITSTTLNEFTVLKKDLIKTIVIVTIIITSELLISIYM